MEEKDFGVKFSGVAGSSGVLKYQITDDASVEEKVALLSTLPGRRSGRGRAKGLGLGGCSERAWVVVGGVWEAGRCRLRGRRQQLARDYSSNCI